VARFTRRQRVFIFLFVLMASVGLTGAVLLHPVGPHLRAMSLLLRFSDSHAQGLPTRFANHPFQEEDEFVLTPHGSLRYRTYTPRDIRNPGGVVLLHGVHHLGIEDPRIGNLARALAGAGVLVMTPELQDLADYRVTAKTIDVIGDSVIVLSTRMNRTVGVIGLSFAGGLSLLAANRTEFRDRIGFVVAIGAHDDMGRVARFFAANVISKPDGVETPFHAHEYGALVLAYSHLEDFFSTQDAPVAREALRQWLWEQPDAMKTAANLSPNGQQELDLLLHHRDQLRIPLLDEVTLHKDEMDAVSPHDHLMQLHTPVFLLHGAGDTIIPSSETLWLAKDVPQNELRAALISPALSHVDLGDKATWQQQWQLVDFMAQVLEATDKLPAQIVFLEIRNDRVKR
jgi:pimeloyl-ACP methyl ester carboxylesterase